MPFSGNLLNFLVLCLVWGLTWIATKIGIDSVPPLLFAATRFMAAGLLVSLWSRRELTILNWPRKDIVRLVAVSLLMITLSYGPLFWGMRYLSSGMASVLWMSLAPLALLGFGVALGQDRWNWVNALAMALGIAGLCILFAPSFKTMDGQVAGSMIGFVAVAWSAISYSWGSVMARPLIARYGSGALSSATMLIGGVAMLLISLVGEHGATQSLLAFWGWPAASGWLFLLVFGSLIGYGLYMQLLRDLGPTKAGSFAFVSPMIAVLVGVVAAGETVSTQSVIGMTVMLLAAGACLYDEALEALIARIAIAQSVPREKLAPGLRRDSGDSTIAVIAERDCGA